MSQSNEGPDKGHDMPGNPLERMQESLLQDFRATGLTVTVVEGSDGGDYTASIPQGRRPKSRAGGADNNEPRRQAKPGHAATIQVAWGYEAHELTLTPEQWSSVMSGHEIGLEGPGYFYDGKHFQDYWNFGGGSQGSLVVSYDGGGVGVDFLLCNAVITVFAPCPQSHIREVVEPTQPFVLVR
jgi:hypothetical protein